MQSFIIISKYDCRIFERHNMIDGTRGRRNHEDPAALVDVGYRILNSIEFLIRAASGYISHHAPVLDLISRNRLFPKAPLHEHLFDGEARLPNANDRNHASATLTACTLNAPNVDVVLNVLIGFGLPPRRTVIAT